MICKFGEDLEYWKSLGILRYVPGPINVHLIIDDLIEVARARREGGISFEDSRIIDIVCTRPELLRKEFANYIAKTFVWPTGTQYGTSPLASYSEFNLFGVSFRILDGVEYSPRDGTSEVYVVSIDLGDMYRCPISPVGLAPGNPRRHRMIAFTDPTEALDRFFAGC